MKKPQKEKSQKEYTPRLRMRQVQFEAQNVNQQKYADDIMDNEISFGLGPAGTGKTYVALTCAADLLSRKEIKQIIITRPNVSSGEKSLGFFKGTKEEKIEEWMRPALKILKKHFGAENLQIMREREMVVLEPLETMRGETFDDAFVLLDEAQNTTWEDLKMFLTRIGQNSYVVVDGDIEQTDLHNKSGLKHVLNMLNGQFPITEFTVDDIVRSKLTKQMVIAFRKYEKENPHVQDPNGFHEFRYTGANGFPAKSVLLPDITDSVLSQ